MQVSVVVPSLDSPIIDRTISSLRAQTFEGEYEIIVVGLDRQGLIQGDGVHFISTGEPVGPAVARNIGIDAARGELVCFCDADCEVAPEWLARLVDQQRLRGGVVGGAVDFPGGHYWAVCDNVVAFRHVMRLSPPGARRYVPTISFCASRQVLIEAGKFDEQFPYPAGEDVDLCLRIAALGHGIYFDPGAIVYHYHQRLRPRDTWARFARYGVAWAQIRLVHRAQWTRFARVFGVLQRWPALMFLSAPLIIGYNVSRDVMASPSVFVRYWYTLPAFVLANLAWVWGAAKHMISIRSEMMPDG
jgi:glycosyltransferase involved in cell wall biosynthesis